MALSPEAIRRIEDQFDEAHERRADFLARVARLRGVDSVADYIATLNIPPEKAAALANGESSALEGLTDQQRCEVLAIKATRDFQEIGFLRKGLMAARAVGRLVDAKGNAADGTCFMISKKLLLTAHHAIKDPDVARLRHAEFGYERDLKGNPKRPRRFKLDPDTFFFGDERDTLDFTVVALGDPITNGARAPTCFCPLPTEKKKYFAETFVNIIQHPRQEPKQVVFRENRVVCEVSEFLYYMADTRGGSSGAPVFNDDWQVVGVHRWGKSPKQLKLPDGCPYLDDVNQGVPALAISRRLSEYLTGLSGTAHTLLAEALGE